MKALLLLSALFLFSVLVLVPRGVDAGPCDVLKNKCQTDCCGTINTCTVQWSCGYQNNQVTSCSFGINGRNCSCSQTYSDGSTVTCSRNSASSLSPSSTGMMMVLTIAMMGVAFLI
eukprot:TRINITY_DN21059_c0_g1_i1.p1 TRINITY_DN21059_c0_g1~~TRINITY_DN21059_c0_g1_i1.p1  ORF type:complete len:126 (-),score=17.54 TRINITY_DN21059_c0_g1_i1:109-456(-)